MGRIDVNRWHDRYENPQAIEREIADEKGRGWLMRWLPARAHDNGLFLIFSNGNDMIIANLDAQLRDRSTGVRWIKARRPELYGPLTEPTGQEQETRAVWFEYDDEAAQ